MIWFKGEYDKPLLIMEPGSEYRRGDGSIGTYYNAKKVYDVSQTTMREMGQEQPLPDDRQLVRALVSRPPVDIVAVEPDQLPGNRGAVYRPEVRCIYVRKGMDVKNIFTNLVPELVLAGYDNGEDFDRTAHASKAYFAAYMVCKKYGIDTSAFEFDYAPAAFEAMEPQQVRSEISQIRDAANTVLMRMSRILDQHRSEDRPQQREVSR